MTLLCPQAKRLLDAFYAKGMEGNMPTIEFDTPIEATGTLAALGLDPGDRLVSQVVINAANVPVNGVQFPAIILTGRDPYGQTLPKWLYAADEEGMAALVKLVTDISAIAVRAAAKANTGG